MYKQQEQQQKQQLAKLYSNLKNLRYTNRGVTGVRGICSIKDIKAGETILTTPSVLHLTAESLKQEKDDILHSVLLYVLGENGENDDDNDNDGLAIGLQILLGVCSVESLKEIKDIDDNNLASYLFSVFIHSLPPPSDFYLLPLTWSDSQLDLLFDDSIITSVKEKKKWLHSKYNLLITRLDENLSHSSPILITLRQILTWELFLWAMCCVQSRCFISADHVLSIALIPFADLFNHNGPGCNLSDTFIKEKRNVVVKGEEEDDDENDVKQDVKYVQKKKQSSLFSFTLSARLDIKQGEELTISYGDRSGKDLLETFGFLPKVQTNICDTISLPIRHLLDQYCDSTCNQQSLHKDVRTQLILELQESLDIEGGAELCAGPLADDEEYLQIFKDKYNSVDRRDARDFSTISPLLDTEITIIEKKWDFCGPCDDTSQLFRILAFEKTSDTEQTPSLERFRRPISRSNEIASMELLKQQIALYFAVLMKRFYSNSITTKIRFTSIFDNDKVEYLEQHLSSMSAHDLAILVAETLVNVETEAIEKTVSMINEMKMSPTQDRNDQDDFPILSTISLPCYNLFKNRLKDEEERYKEINTSRLSVTILYIRNRLRILLVHLQHIARLVVIANGVTAQPITPGARLLIVSALCKLT